MSHPCCYSTTKILIQLKKDTLMDIEKIFKFVMLMCSHHPMHNCRLFVISIVTLLLFQALKPQASRCIVSLRIISRNCNASLSSYWMLDLYVSLCRLRSSSPEA